MHGLINKAFEGFLVDSFGAAKWQAILRGAGLVDEVGSDGFDALRLYPDAVTEAVLNAAVAELGRPRESLLEDLGTYLVSHPRTERLRRLMRFGGGCYTDFLRSLGDLNGRTRLAVPDLHLPRMTLEDLEPDAPVPGRFRLTCHDCPPGFSLVVLGILRAMGDDYGALVVLEPLARPAAAGRRVQDPDRAGPAADAGAMPGGRVDECLVIDVHDPAFHEGRQFELAAVGAA